MQSVLDKSVQKIRDVDTSFRRYLYDKINWNDRLIILEGARGVGKTTLLLQHLKLTYGESEQVMYVSLDDLWFAKNTLVALVSEFVKLGGKAIYIDEVHKYADWMREVKNIYDDYPGLSIVLTGSSSLHLAESKADLSRRAMFYKLNELSLREYISLSTGKNWDVYELQDILKNHRQIATRLTADFRPLKWLNEYNLRGTYPFSLESPDSFLIRLERVMMTVLEVDLPAVLNIDFRSVQNLKKLLYVISTSAPFKPNISNLSDKTGIARDTLLRYLHYLEQANLIMLLKSNKKGMSYLTKPEKIYLQNASLMHVLSAENRNVGTLRETFFLNQMKNVAQVFDHPTADFTVNETYVFEIGGKSKGKKQILGVDEGYIVSDDLEIGFQNKIPLWLFGFLY